ncbi:5'-nucleotidase [Holothuria leucospilota]|uniref:5'-nucleotidase n=1 Tax=Holothuria leucospilota TaxID=206669 RepID=A0A9Q1BPY1_HOLLE|nr:5'-nucleotidase [Holothuria leucospilota]
MIFENEISPIQLENDILTSAGINKIIAVGNSGYDVKVEIAKKTGGLDVIAGRNSFKFLYNGKSPTNDVVTGPYLTIVYRNGDKRTGDSVLLVQDSTFGKYLGFLQVTFDDQGKSHTTVGTPYYWIIP